MVINKNKIQLYVDKNSHDYKSTMENFRNVFNKLKESGINYQVEFIDVNENAQIAKKENIQVTPTLIVSNQKFMGQFLYPKILEFLKNNYVI